MAATFYYTSISGSLGTCESCNPTASPISGGTWGNLKGKFKG